MKVCELIEDYRGFDWENGEVVLVDQRAAKSYICTVRGEKLTHTFHDLEYAHHREAWSWTHTKKTMLITI